MVSVLQVIFPALGFFFFEASVATIVWLTETTIGDDCFHLNLAQKGLENSVGLGLLIVDNVIYNCSLFLSISAE